MRRALTALLLPAALIAQASAPAPATDAEAAAPEGASS
jgi:hypothetical protein